MKKKGKKKMYDDLKKLPTLKSKLDAFIDLFTRQAFSDKIILEEVYKAVVDYDQISYLFLKAFPELLTGSNRKRVKTLLTSMAVAKAIRTLYTRVVKDLLEERLVQDGIFTQNKKGELIATAAFKQDKVYFDWDKVYAEFKKENFKMLLMLLDQNEVVISQILQEFAEYTDENERPYYTEFMFLEKYIYEHGYKEFADNLDNMQVLFQESTSKEFINNTSFEIYTKFKEKKVASKTKKKDVDLYALKETDAIKDSYYNKLIDSFNETGVRLTFMENKDIDSLLKDMSSELESLWSSYGKKNKKQGKKA